MMTQNPTHKSLYIQQLNTNSIRNKRHEMQILLEKYSREGKTAIILLNDTRLNDQDVLNFKGHYTLRRDHSSNSHLPGGVAAIIPNSITTKELTDFHEIEIEALGFEFEFAGREMRVVTAYPHPGEELQHDFYESLVRNSENKFICFMSDTNAHIGALHDEETNRPSSEIGDRLLNNFSDRGLQLVNDLIPTYFSASNPNYSELLDMCFIKQANSNLGWDWSSECCYSSDHNLTSLEVWAPEETPVNQEWITIVNWEKVKTKMITKAWPRIEEMTKEGIDKNIRELTEAIQEIIRTSSRPVKKNQKGHFILSATLSEWISVRRKLNKLRQAHKAEDEAGRLIRSISNRCNRSVKRMIKEEAKTHEENKGDNIAKERDTTKRWKKFNEFCKEQNEATKVSGIIDETDGIIKTKDIDLAQIHANRLEKTHSDPEDPIFDQEWKEHVESEVNERINEIRPNTTPDPYVLHEEPVTVEEIISNLKHTKNNAPGMDQVTNKVLKMGNDGLLIQLSILFTLILSLGYYPDQWKIGLVMMIAKSGRDLSFSKNFRPITLLSVLGKLLEAIILKRLKRARAMTTPENIHQAGYKSKRSCLEHLLRIIESVYNAFNRRLCALACFLDVDSAFDAIWTYGLYYKIIYCQIPSYLKKIMADFLRNRRLVVQVNKERSRTIRMRAGTPQGAVLSPEIFKIYTDDLILNVPGQVEFAQFADDLSLWTIATNKLYAAESLQNALNNISVWCKSWRMKLSPRKSVSLFFNKCQTNDDPTVKIYLNEEEIEQKTKCRFLGVILDCKLLWGEYVKDMINRTKFKVHVIRELAVRQRRRHKELVLNYFKMLVTPVYSFASLCYLTMSPTHWQKLETFQTQSIRSILGIPSHIPDQRVLDGTFNISYRETLTRAAINRIKSIMSNSPFRAVLERQAQETLDETYTSPLQYIYTHHPEELADT